MTGTADRPLRIGSLCSGYGGLDLGVQRVLHAEVAWHCEYAAGPSRILAHHYPTIPNHHDLTTTDWSAVEPVDVLTGGYPCQPFSRNGGRKGTDDPRHLWPHIARAVRVLRPQLVLLENVSSHLSLGFGDVLADLAAAGFDAEWGVFRASDAGAPHGRPRLFIAAADPGRVLHAAAEPAGLDGAVRPKPAPAGAERVDRAGAGRDEDQGGPDAGGAGAAFGPYAAAVERWERLTGRRAPDPVLNRADGPDLNPRLVEWVMGLPAGWVTDVPGLNVDAQLTALGNGVVPQQAELAYRHLLN